MLKPKHQKLKALTLFLVTLTSSFALSTKLVLAIKEEEALGDKVKEIREAVKEKVREKINEVKQGQKKAFVGEINEISDGLLTLKIRSGLGYVQIATDAAVLDTNRQQADPNKLTTGDFVIAMGFMDENSILQTKRLLVIKKPTPKLRRAVFGTVSDLSSTEKILTVKNPKTGTIYSIEVTNKTVITKKNGGKKEEIDFDQIEINDRVVAVGKAEENSEIMITATRLHLLPSIPVAHP